MKNIKPESEKVGYSALISTDWNECLSPMGPFDPIIFAYPELGPRLGDIFREYTSNRITLNKAVSRLRELMPAPLTIGEMDAYLDSHFKTYKGVPELMNWCGENSVLFMINTTASIGFFQRVFAKGLLPSIPALSAHPGIRFDPSRTDPEEIYELHEITDKSINTKRAAAIHGVSFNRIMIIGDSGGDGPHFQWGAKVGAFLTGSMTKWSLESYCRQRGIRINLYFGPRYLEGEKRNRAEEMSTDFRKLEDVVRKLLD